jgi:hypothetical protein
VSESTQRRPPQVTIASIMVMVGSVLVVLSVWDRLGTLRSIESRDAISNGLQDPPFSGLGLDVEGVISLLHTASMVTAGCAAAMAILGWYALQRNLQARLVLTVLAVPLFVGGLAAGGFFTSLVAASVAILWMQPAREWFTTGRWTPPAPPAKDTPSAFSRSGPPESTTPDATVHTTPGGPTSTTPPPATTPYASGPSGQPVPHPHAAPPAARTPYGQPLPQQPYGAAPGWGAPAAPQRQRPTALVVGAIVTFVSAGLTALLALMTVLLVVLSPELVMTELERQQPDVVADGLTQSTMVTSTVITGTITIVWSVLAIVLAVFALAGRERARRALVVCAGASAVALLGASLGAIFPIVPALAAVITVLQLRRPEVRQWCSANQPRDGMGS